MRNGDRQPRMFGQLFVQHHRISGDNKETKADQRQLPSAEAPQRQKQQRGAENNAPECNRGGLIRAEWQRRSRNGHK